MMAKWLPQSSLVWPTSDPFSQGRFGEQASMISCHASPVAHLHKYTSSQWERDIKRVKKRESDGKRVTWPEEQQNSLRKRLKVVVSVDLAVVPQANLTKHLWSQKHITHHELLGTNMNKYKCYNRHEVISLGKMRRECEANKAGSDLHPNDGIDEEQHYDQQSNIRKSLWTKRERKRTD